MVRGFACVSRYSLAKPESVLQRLSVRFSTCSMTTSSSSLSGISKTESTVSCIRNEEAGPWNLDRKTRNYVRDSEKILKVLP